MKGYRNSMPLQPLPHRLLQPFFEGVHVLRQKEALCQTLNNMDPFTFFPDPHTSACGKWLAIQQKLRLPHLCDLGGGCYAWLGLGLRLLNNNAAGWLRRSSGCCISRTSRRLLSNSLPLPNPSSLRRRLGGGGRHLTLALRRWLLCGLSRVGHEMVYGHSPPVHHIFTKVGFGI